MQKIKKQIKRPLKVNYKSVKNSEQQFGKYETY